jgi:putative transcriptional regulator
MIKKKIHIENAVRKLRFNSDEMTQQELAELVGVSRQTIVSIEKYKYTPSLDLAFKIALAFDREIQEVFFIN